jgi:ABC-type transport system involved in multi-copper enzyme maturation permease subunit
MFNIILIICGIVCMIVSIGQCFKLLSANNDRSLQKYLYVILFLVLFFLIGYILYLYLTLTQANITGSTMLISLILFFGAIFVIIVLSVSLTLVNSLLLYTQRIDKANKVLEENENVLKQKQTDLEKVQENLKNRNMELEKTLTDFYTLRLGMQKDMEAGKVEEENQKIKQRLDKLRDNAG